ncbi:hypothetical protein IFR05_007635 [Cadophora sp. M221]|nr:hypothetical protein IFR05_007635 [Cadophora sp. M221]
MLSIKCFFVLVIVSSVGALQNPHEEAAKFLKRSTPPESTKNAPRFAVKGNKLPEVDFNIGESYAGTLPIGPPSVGNANNLWFWFFPSTNPAAKKEIVIWLSGALAAVHFQLYFKQMGPLFGTVEHMSPLPILTNVIYVDQPVGTGFSQGNILVNNETDVANQFMGFWKNFVDTFSIQGHKIYFIGESYAGQFIPWIANAMLDNGNKTYFNVTGVQINDPVVNYPDTLQQDYCPYLWSELGYPSSGGGPSNYFNRSDVQRAIHAPRTNYFVCEAQPNIFPAGDQSLPSGLGTLPSVIDRTKNVIIVHGLLDFLLFADGSLITIQNMTWGGLQGFQTPPSSTFNFKVPSQANQGTTHSERGLTFVKVNLAGHFVPQYTPGAAYRQLEFLLGRISSLEQPGPYTTVSG